MGNYELHTVQLISTCSNCYILVDKSTRTAAIIDPGCAADQIMETVTEANAEVKYIIDTHGHWDHIGNNVAVQEATGAAILIHQLDAPMLSDPELSLARLFRGSGNGGQAARLLEDGDVIELGELTLHVIHTPGHTPGGICLLCEDLLFTGDTLFCMSIGRSDLIAGDYDTLIRSLGDKLTPLDDGLRVLPGHGSASVLGTEKAQNPYFPR
jgi:hydroxyacylglutathione hydrolase